MQNRILLVDDDLTVIKTMSRMLAGVAQIQFACSGEDALRLVRKAPPALILLDAEMPGMSGFQVCESLKADPSLAHIPVIFVTSHSDTEFEVAGFEIGAVDFIAKPVSPPLLVARVKTQLRIKQLADELRSVSLTDGLTHIANRRSFDETFRREWARARRSAEPTGLLMVDVDYFKLFNDRYGHPSGDRCLQQISKALTQAIRRPADFVARYGGEEFVVLLPKTTQDGVAHVATRIMDAIESLGIEHATSPISRHVTVSIGASSFDETSNGWVASPADSRLCEDLAAAVTPAQLLLAADRALYAAKAAGRTQAWMLDAVDVDAPVQAREILHVSRGRQVEATF
jgi:diguanylate cyclase (GGDEF)-like protein